MIDSDRFWRDVEKTDGCWLWTGARTSDGYGSVRVEGRMVGAHRVAYELAHGAMPTGTSVLHTCDVRSCVRPDHLFLGTQEDNVRDMVAKGRANLTGIRGERHHDAKLTADDVREIRRMHAAGEGGYMRLAKRFGVRRTSILKIVRRQTWKDVT